jgi:hypothetical protein
MKNTHDCHSPPCTNPNANDRIHPVTTPQKELPQYTPISVCTRLRLMLRLYHVSTFGSVSIAKDIGTTPTTSTNTQEMTQNKTAIRQRQTKSHTPMG